MEEHKHLLKRAYRLDGFIGHRKRWFLIWVCARTLQTVDGPKHCPHKVYYDITYYDPTQDVLE